MNHTPGPWKVRYLKSDDQESGFFVEAKNNNMPELGYGIEIMGDDYGDHNGYPSKQRLADAKLIAAAPDMFEVLCKLRGIEAWITDREMKELFQKNIYPVIQKAIE